MFSLVHRVSQHWNRQLTLRRRLIFVWDTHKWGVLFHRGGALRSSYSLWCLNRVLYGVILTAGLTQVFEKLWGTWVLSLWLWGWQLLVISIRVRLFIPFKLDSLCFRTKLGAVEDETSFEGWQHNIVVFNAYGAINRRHQSLPALTVAKFFLPCVELLAELAVVLLHLEVSDLFFRLYYRFSSLDIVCKSQISLCNLRLFVLEVPSCCALPRKC